MSTNEHLGYYIARTHNVFKKPIKQIVSQYGLTIQQYGVLRRLYAQDGLPARDLVNQLFIDSSTIMAILDRLEKKDLVRRRTNPNDRRMNNLYLTPKAKKFIPALVAESDELDRQLRKLLSTDECKALESGLSKLYQFSICCENQNQ